MTYNNEQEGVIQFALDYTKAAALSEPALAALRAWRTILHDLQLLGQDPQRYDGYGFGNISVRSSVHPAHFVITGSQTGKPRILGPEGFCTVTEADPAHNHIVAHGPCKPSSESMTHAAIYQTLPGVAAVVHVHAPTIWQAAEQLPAGTTGAEIPYGTPAMAMALQQLTRQQTTTAAVIMRGHRDGVVTWGPNLSAASQVCIDLLAQSLSLLPDSSG